LLRLFGSSSFRRRRRFFLSTTAPVVPFDDGAGYSFQRLWCFCLIVASWDGGDDSSSFFNFAFLRTASATVLISMFDCWVVFCCVGGTPPPPSDSHPPLPTDPASCLPPSDSRRALTDPVYWLFPTDPVFDRRLWSSFNLRRQFLPTRGAVLPTVSLLIAFIPV
jgi:hypothetical protein